MQQNILPLLALAYLLAAGILLWFIYHKQKYNGRYCLVLACVFVAIIVQSYVSIQLLHDAIIAQYSSFVSSLYFLLWITAFALVLFALFVVAHLVLVVAIILAFLACLLQWQTGHPQQYYMHKSLNYAVNWHIVIAILSAIMLLITSLCAFFVSRIEVRLKNACLTESDMIVALPLETTQMVLRSLAAITWLLLTITIVSGYWFTYSLLQQQLTHKLFFTVVAWAAISLFLLLSYKRWFAHSVNARFLYASMIAVLVGYFGTKIVIEFLI